MLASMTWWPVDARLHGLVDAIYVVRLAAPERFELAGSLLPQLHWTLEGRFAWHCRDGRAQPAPRAAAFGPTTAAVSMEHWGSTTVAGLGIYPEGWAALMPVPAGSLIERVVDLETLWPADDAQAPLAADPRGPDAAIAAQVEALMLRRLARAQPVDPRIVAVSRWANGTDHDIDALAEELGVTHRHLNRIAIAAHGLPPRVLANKHKILRMAAMLAGTGHDNRRECWTSEWADQAHFNRNFRRFVGTTPTRFVAEPDLLVRDVMRVRLALASRHPLGLSVPAETG